MPPERPVTLCIVNYQGSQHLPAALLAAGRSSLAFGEILVVDNASTDGSIAWLRSEHPDIRVLELTANRGPAGARNAGFAAAVHDLILFQDNDVQLDVRCAETLLEALTASTHALLVAPRVLYADNPALVQYESADCHFLGLMSTRNADRPMRELPTATLPTTSLVTACFLIDRGPVASWSAVRRMVWLQLRGPRLRRPRKRPGLRVARCAGRTRPARQRDGRISRTGPATPCRSSACFYLIRNRWSVITKSFAARSLLVLAPVLACYELCQLAGVASKGWLGEWFSALQSWWKELPRLRVERQAVQRTRRTSDRLILKGGPLPLTPAVGTGRVSRLAIRMLQGIADGYWRLAQRLL